MGSVAEGEPPAASGARRPGTGGRPCARQAGSVAPAPTVAPGTQGVPGPATAPAKSERIQVRTDLLVAEIDTLGGTIKRLDLLRHRASEDQTKNFSLLSETHRYEAQSGLAGEL